MARLTPMVAGGVVVAVLVFPGAAAVAYENTGGFSVATVTTTVGVDIPARAPEVGTADGGQNAATGPVAGQKAEEVLGSAWVSVAVFEGGSATVGARVVGDGIGVQEGSVGSGNMAAVAVTGMGLLAMLTSAVVAHRRTVGQGPAS